MCVYNYLTKSVIQDPLASQGSDLTKSVTQDPLTTQDSDSTKSDIQDPLAPQDSDLTKSDIQDPLAPQDSDLTKSVTQDPLASQDSVSHSGSIGIKYSLVREDEEERVVPSKSLNSAHMSLSEPLSLQHRLKSSVKSTVVNNDLVISWDELFMGLALLEKKFVNLNDKKPDSKVE